MSANKRKGQVQDETASNNKERKKSKQWTKNEESDIAVHASENYQSFQSMSKTAYTRKMKEVLNMDVDIIQLKDKLGTMESQYNRIKDQWGKTGEGLTYDTLEYRSWEAYVKGQCHFYFILDSVMSSRANISPAYEVNTGPAEPTKLTDDQFNRLMEETDEAIAIAKELVTEHDGPVTPTPTTKKSKEGKKVKQKLQRGSSSAIADAMKMQAEVSGQYYARLDECKKLKLQNHAKTQTLEKRRVTLEGKKEDRLLKLEEAKQRNDFDLEKLQLEREREKENSDIEKLKLQIELEKLRK